MRKILSAAVLACLALAPMSARADDNSVQVGKDLYMSAGMKLWINTWQTNLTGNSGKDWTQLTADPVVGIVPNLSLKYKQLLIAGSFMATGDYQFPHQTFKNGTAVRNELDVKGNRQEIDLNVGFYVVPQVALTMGYKGITEKFKVTSSLTGYSENSVYLNGVTFGITGSAPIGNGFSVYGSGAGGPMFVTYTPASSYTDTALYEASELGFAWHAPRAPLTATLGYKFQLIQTSISSQNSVNFSGLPRTEVTRGLMLGLSYLF